MTNLHYWLAAVSLPQIGPRKFLKWLNFFNEIEKIFTASDDALHACHLTAAEINAIKNPDWNSVEVALDWQSHPEHHILTLIDAQYPRALKEIADPPLVLFVQGNVRILQQVQFAMVGSRHASPMGIQNAQQFASRLSESGFVITSGLALGIDAASHRGALLAKGLTVAVMGTGLKNIYPASHKRLATTILQQQGALISEFPLETKPLACNFPRRNRIISGMSVGVLIVEAALKSGSLITAKYALEQGREVFAIPGSIHHPQARGCHHLLRQGAKLVETAQDIIEELNGFCILKQTRISPPENRLTEKAQTLLAFVGYEITSLDVIILRSGLTVSEVSSILLVLELEGYIQSVQGGYLRLS